MLRLGTFVAAKEIRTDEVRQGVILSMDAMTLGLQGLAGYYNCEREGATLVPDANLFGEARELRARARAFFEGV